MTARPGMELTSPDALDRLPTGTYITVNGHTFAHFGATMWIGNVDTGLPVRASTDELLEFGPATVTRIPGGAE